MNTAEILPPESIPTFKPTAEDARNAGIDSARAFLLDASVADKNVLRYWDSFIGSVRVACYGQSVTEIAAFLLAQFAVHLIRRIKR